MTLELDRRRFNRHLGFGVGTLALAPRLWAAAPPTPESARLQRLLEQHWQASSELRPEWATYRGDHRFGDRLSDESPAGVAARDALATRSLAEARTIDRARLPPAERVSLDVFIYGLEREVRLQAFEGYRCLGLGTLGGVQNDFANLLRVSPARTAAEAGQILARFAGCARWLEQQTERLKRGVQLGWVSPRPVVERALAQLDGQLRSDASRGPFFEPFQRLGSDIPAPEAEALRERARAAIETQVLPPMRRLRTFIAEAYLSAAPAAGGFSRYPRGAEVYAQLVQDSTTLRTTPRERHDVGLDQLGRLRAEMEGVMREEGFKGDFAAFVKYLNSDPKFFYPDGEALLEGYRAIAKRIDPQLPKLFAELPRAPYGIRAMPAHLGPGAPENYTAPPQDLSQPGWFNANVLAYANRPKWAMETLVAHETVPGHHLQSARAREMAALPAFRRNGFYTAYGEGWALYAETLGPELGLYTNRLSRFGHLQAQAFRAARLVVDTGLHAFDWPRERAIDFMVEQVGRDREFLTAEVDRYLAQPAQALAYMTGQLKLTELRQRARRALGARFDIRAFHNLLLDGGALPLQVLERVVDEWISAA